VHSASEALPVMSAVPVVTAAAATFVAGALGAIVWHGGAEDGDRHIALSTAAGGGVALVLVVALLGTAWFFGDDDRYVHATTAQAAAVPAVPATIGKRYFSMRVADGSMDLTPTATVAPAGPGFVVKADRQVTAYDSAGHERWHFRREAPAWMSLVGSYDQGRVVVLNLFNPEGPSVDYPLMLGLDGQTGRQLWFRADPTLSAAVDRHIAGLLPHLVTAQADSWTGFDPATGAKAWQIPNPMRCAFQKRLTVDTEAALAGIDICSNGNTSRFRLVSVDPAMGAIVVDKSLDLTAETDDIDSVRICPAGTSGSDSAAAQQIHAHWRHEHLRQCDHWGHHRPR
jgi:hypothetical protein